jgi:hypothetical protein
MYFWNTKPAASFLDHHNKVLCTGLLFYWYICTDTTGVAHIKIKYNRFRTFPRKNTSFFLIKRHAVKTSGSKEAYH